MNILSLLRSLGIIAAATGSFAQDVKTDFDHNIDFAQYKTYSWEKVQTQDPLWVSRIKAVNAALTAKAGRQSVRRKRRHCRDRNDSGTQYAQHVLRRFRRGLALEAVSKTTTTVENYKVGTLVVDLFDAKTKKLIWRGSSAGTLSDKSEKNIKILDKEAQKMFDHFPPSPKK